MRICLSCWSVRGIWILPICASWMSWSSSCSVNSGFIIFRFVNRCRASGERICLRSACFWASICSSWVCFWSWARFCQVLWLGLRRFLGGVFCLSESSVFLEALRFGLILLAPVVGGLCGCCFRHILKRDLF